MGIGYTLLHGLTENLYGLTTLQLDLYQMLEYLLRRSRGKPCCSNDENGFAFCKGVPLHGGYERRQHLNVAFADPAPQITPPSANNVKLTLEDSNLSNGDFTVRLFEIYLLYIMVWCHFQNFWTKTSPSISKLDLSPKWLGSARRSLKVKNLSCENGKALFSVHICTYE